MSLKKGYYKFRHGEGRGKTFHYVHIFNDPTGRQFIRIDHAEPQELTPENETYLIDFRENHTLVKEYTRLNPTKINMPRITIQFKDEDGDPHEMSVRSLKRMEEIFELYPRLKKALE